MQNLVTTLQGITKANEYAISIRKVMRIKMSGLNITEFPTVVVIPADEPKSQEPSDKYTCRLAFTLECWLTEQGGDISARVNTLLAEVERALMADHTRGGVAVDTRILSNSAFYNEVNKPYGGININIEIHYRHKLNDPYTAG